MENARLDVTKDQVKDYFTRLEAEFYKSPRPCLIINVDESGFIQRPLKNSSKNCVISRDCSTKPCFREYSDWNHVSVVAAVTLSGIPLKPLLISTTNGNYLC